MSTNYNVTLLDGEKTAEAVLLQNDLEWKDGRPTCRLELVFSAKSIKAEAIDWFEALIELRRQVEPDGLLFQLYGASRNVWPSGMCRDMGLGRNAYRMTMGKRVERIDMVPIFSTGPDVVPATIAEQERFKNEWLASFSRQA